MNAASNLQLARAAGINETDVYMFPCPKRCEGTKTASQQVQEMSM